MRSSRVMGLARSCEVVEFELEEGLGGPPFGDKLFTELASGALATRLILAGRFLGSDTDRYAYNSLRNVSLSSSTASRCWVETANLCSYPEGWIVSAKRIKR